MSRRYFLDDSIAQVQTKEKGNFSKSHKFHQLDYRFSVKKGPSSHLRRRALHFQLLLFAVDDIAEVGAADDLLHVLSLVSPEDLKELAVRGDELVGRRASACARRG